MCVLCGGEEVYEQFQCLRYRMLHDNLIERTFLQLNALTKFIRSSPLTGACSACVRLAGGNQ